MRLLKYINENDIDTDIIVSLIKKNCQPYLSMTKNKGTIMFRGIKISNTKCYSLQVDKNRNPKDLHKNNHGLLNDGFMQVYNKPLRSISIFVTGDFYFAEEFGNNNVFYIFPQRNFTFYWSSNIRDIYKFSEWIPTLNILKNVNEYNMYLSIFIFTYLWNARGRTDNLKSWPPVPQTIITDLLNTYKDLYKKVLNISIDNILNTGFDISVISKASKIFIKSLYTDKDLISGLKSGNEILIDCKKYYAIPESIIIENKNLLKEIYE